MASTAHDLNQESKSIPHAMGETPLDHLIRTHLVSSEIEGQHGSRKRFGIDFIKDDLTLAPAPGKGEGESHAFDHDNTHRKLRLRHIQLICIGGTIGTALFVAIGHGLLNGGPASLFIAFTVW